MDQPPFRLKDSLDDFRVTELSDFPMDGGPFAVYTLHKRNIGTLEALDEFRPLLGRGFISFGGLKDKYAVTEQFIAVENGPRRNIRSETADLEYLNQAPRPFESRDILANRFTIVLRDMNPADAERLQTMLEGFSDWWTPNYFDEQRFGSLGESGVFMAEHWCRGNWEQAIRLALTDSNLHDESNDVREKQLLAEHWNDWSACPLFRDPVRHAVVSHLADRPGDYRGAITRIPHSQRSLYLSAFQSAIWNRLLSAEIAARLADSAVNRFRVADASLAMPTGTEPCDFLAGLSLPFPTARQPIPEGPLAERLTEILKDYNLEYRELRVKYPRDTFFSKGERGAGFQAVGLKHFIADDERYPGRKKLNLEFDLPRGCYATMLIRRIADSLAI